MRAISVSLVVAFAVIALGCGKPSNSQAVAYNAYDEEALAKLTTGKTIPQVIELLGNPDATYGNNRDVFHYHNRIKNPYTQKLDTAFVYFENGIVVKVKGR